jgi:hypothetical protein
MFLIHLCSLALIVFDADKNSDRLYLLVLL